MRATPVRNRPRQGGVDAESARFIGGCHHDAARTRVIARGDEFSFWDVESLQPIRQLRRDVAQFPGWVAFSPDGKLMAVEMAPAVIHLKEVTTGRTVAKKNASMSTCATQRLMLPSLYPMRKMDRAWSGRRERRVV